MRSKMKISSALIALTSLAWLTCGFAGNSKSQSRPTLSQCTSTSNPYFQGTTYSTCENNTYTAMDSSCHPYSDAALSKALKAIYPNGAPTVIIKCRSGYYYCNIIRDGRTAGQWWTNGQNVYVCATSMPSPFPSNPADNFS